MKIHPTSTRILLQTAAPEEKTQSGIFIPKGAGDKERPVIGTVVEVGPAHTVVEIGDKVLFSELGFEPVEIEGKKYQIGLEENILAILEDDAPAT